MLRECSRVSPLLASGRPALHSFRTTSPQAEQEYSRRWQCSAIRWGDAQPPRTSAHGTDMLTFALGPCGVQIGNTTSQTIGGSLYVRLGWKAPSLYALGLSESPTMLDTGSRIDTESCPAHPQSCSECFCVSVCLRNGSCHLLCLCPPTTRWTMRRSRPLRSGGSQPKLR